MNLTETSFLLDWEMGTKDLREVTRRNKEWKRREKSLVGDYVTFYNQVKREIKYSKPLYKRFTNDS